MQLYFTIFGAVYFTIFGDGGAKSYYILGLSRSILLYIGACVATFYYILGLGSNILLYLGLVQLYLTIFGAGAAIFY